MIMVKMKYDTSERDKIRAIADKYGCSPFTGECYVEEVLCSIEVRKPRGKNKLKNPDSYYSIQVPIEIAEKFLLKEDFMEENERRARAEFTLFMIKPVEGDGNYIFFRRP